MEQVIDIEKVNEFNFLNEEVEELASRRSQSLVNARSSSYLRQKNFDFVYEGITRLYFQLFVQTRRCVVSLS